MISPSHLAAALLCVASLHAQDTAACPRLDLTELRELPQKTQHVLAEFPAGKQGEEALKYFLFPPDPAKKAPGEKFPLVVVLHHAGAERDLGAVLTMNPESIGLWLKPAFRKSHPSYVLVPWSGGHHWESGDWHKASPLSASPTGNSAAVLRLIGDMRDRLPIDPSRIYLVGQSMGAFGVWDLVSRRPQLFAAAIPVCGGGDPVQAPHLKNLPIWTFHGEADEIIPVERTRKMAEAITALGASHFTYTEYKEASHDRCSEQAFTEPDLAAWLFRQKKLAGRENLIRNPGE